MVTLAATLPVFALAACGGGSRSAPVANVSTGGAAPLQLGANANAPSAQPVSVLGPIDEAKARKAIENYRLSKKRKKAPYRLAGADINGDGVREALVLFQGKDWCKTTGCSMAVFQDGTHGFRVISRTVRVKAPVEIEANSTNGFRDLLVQTGGGPAPERRVRLQFSGEGYSRNAMHQSEVPLGSLVRTEIVFPKTNAASTSAQGASARNP